MGHESDTVPLRWKQKQKEPAFMIDDIGIPSGSTTYTAVFGEELIKSNLSDRMLLLQELATKAKRQSKCVSGCHDHDDITQKGLQEVMRK